MDWFHLLKLLAESVSLYLVRIDLLVIAGVVLLMIYGQYKRTADVEMRMFGFIKNRPMDQLKYAILYGFFGGLLVTFVFLLLGVSLAEVGIWQLWILAIVLMLIRPRFLCFSYGAGILAVSHLLFGVPEINIPALMAVVAILHLVESILIRLVGAEGASPIYIRRGSNEVVGGFMLQKFWPIPFIALVGAFVPLNMVDMTQGVHMPDWWPILRQGVTGPVGMEYVFSLFPVIAALGYSDVAITCRPEVKARRTARSLFIYSMGLLVLAVLAQYGTVYAVAAALFSPIAHEWVIRRERSIEHLGTPCYTGEETMILDVHPNSPAKRAGLRSGDVIRAVNGETVATRKQFWEAIQPWAIDAEFLVENVISGELRTVRVDGKIPPVGIILVPGQAEGVVMEMKDESVLKRYWHQLKQRWNRSA